MARATPIGLSLVGYRGAGKSTIGPIVAERLGLPFLDVDQELEARVGRSIRAIFAEQGEAAFRDYEEATLRALTEQGPSVLATGGGAVLREANRQVLRRFGPVIWLSARPEVLAQRLRADRQERPALTASGTLAEVAAVLETRLPFYREAADVTIDTTDRSPAEVAEEVVRLWRGRTREAGGMA
ncbi:MAG: shikimate kinase [Isosphaeraceae bacterium]|nr:shikimate kinase [Isosphaeraceae bacterium]